MLFLTIFFFKREHMAAKAASEGGEAYYYDTDDAYNFYMELWGGDHLHVGIFDDDTANVRYVGNSRSHIPGRETVSLAPPPTIPRLSRAFALSLARSLSLSLLCLCLCLSRSLSLSLSLLFLSLSPFPHPFTEARNAHSCRS